MLRSVNRLRTLTLNTSASRRSLATAAPAAPNTVKLEVNGVPVEVEKGSALIQACEKAGVTIPR